MKTHPSTSFRPMLAGGADLASLQFPLFASPKIDGVRCTVHGGVAYSRSRKPLPNRAIQAWAGQHAEALEGLDGELVVGDPWSPTVYRDTVSVVMADAKEEPWLFLVFDHTHMAGDFNRRHANLSALSDFMPPRTRLLAHYLVGGLEDLEGVERVCLERGYEGLILRAAEGLYKQGRSTARGGEMLKLKRFEDAEAVVIGVVELLHNGNEATTNEIGRTARSNHKAGKTGMGVLGALTVRGLTAFEGVEFEIGTGFTAADREALWRDSPVGRIAKFKHFPVGAKDKPRHPVFLGWRDPIDMETRR